MNYNTSPAELIYESLESTCKTHTFGYGKWGGCNEPVFIIFFEKKDDL